NILYQVSVPIQHLQGVKKLRKWLKHNHSWALFISKLLKTGFYHIYPLFCTPYFLFSKISKVSITRTARLPGRRIQQPEDK
ncbi:hypothetical protein, partial [Bilifractor porci]|uniref:hypothetical protein n=1 Tax=Bilifractor porci TaxID=2606636 RepID=UPI00197C8134